jgi:hypothetical protein
MGRQVMFAEELADNNVVEHATVLLQQVNGLLECLSLKATVRSGWRPRLINKRVGGSKNSYHIIGRAIDLADTTGALKAVIKEQSGLLRTFNLWMEEPSKTPTWCHLDNGTRLDRPIRIFIP